MCAGPYYFSSLTFVSLYNFINPEINLATPPCEIFDEATLVPTSNWTGTDNSTTTTSVSQSPSAQTPTNNITTSFNATTPPKTPSGTMEPGHIALIVIFTFLIVIVVIIFIVITIKMARSGQVTKLPQLSKIPAMCKKQNTSEGEGKKKDLSMAFVISTLGQKYM